MHRIYQYILDGAAEARYLPWTFCFDDSNPTANNIAIQRVAPPKFFTVFPVDVLDVDRDRKRCEFFGLQAILSFSAVAKKWRAHSAQDLPAPRTSGPIRSVLFREVTFRQGTKHKITQILTHSHWRTNQGLWSWWRPFFFLLFASLLESVPWDCPGDGRTRRGVSAR